MAEIPEDAIQAAVDADLTGDMLTAYETILDALRPYQTPDGTLHASAPRIAARLVTALAPRGRAATRGTVVVDLPEDAI